ncbi:MULTISPECIES: CRISPR system precrRNA processing endoribonuclease RAMP protein Cas6 [Rodentibacter]|uniref:CRISPR system precrRNA processing endoribonuclease RAMP protein Cas6 n=1 Tax=Rodentibacter TaxID=1960084 RepID=UPI001CFED7F0|nr:CRISPR system precrRNA processing endoribonuclease RAMP protein Cas6 [Rodentibacter sp. JRC1]GJI56751.1 CRISPR-associated protein Cas6 [Rodentibacter sp. JRC1]
MDFKTLSVARYRFIFQVSEPIFLPEYAGSTLRGVFGRSLRKICCMTKLENCKTCPLYRSCPYTAIFETPAPLEHQVQKFSQVPNGYIIEPPKWGERVYQQSEKLAFDVVLFGRLLNQLPLITFAFKRAFEYQVGKGKALLVDLRHNDQSILVNDHIIEHNAQIELPGNLSSSLCLHFETPLRLQENGQPIGEKKIKINRLLLGLAKRIMLLSEFHDKPISLNFEQLKQGITEIEDHKQLYWQDWTRYSSRQNQKMKLGGLVGNWALNNVPEDWQQLIYMGQWLHVGKNATFGLGKYQLL